MGITNINLIIQISLISALLLFSILFTFAVFLNVNDFNGNCLFHAQGKWIKLPNDTKGNLKLEITAWGSGSLCGFNKFVGVTCILTCFSMIVWLSYHIWNDTKPSWLCCLVMVILDMFALLFWLISAFIIKSGFESWCKLITSRDGRPCGLSQYFDFLVDETIYVKRFYILLSVSVVSGWLCVISWSLMIFLPIYQLYRYSRRERFVISARRERDRFVQLVRPQYNYEAI